MLFDLQLLGASPDAPGNADVIENRTLAAASIEEAVRTAKNIVLNTPVPGVYGFRLLRSGLESLIESFIELMSQVFMLPIFHRRTSC